MIKGAISAYYTYRILRILSWRWEDTPAFKAGVVDKTGKLIADTLTPEQKRSYGSFDRVCYNLKRVMSKIPGGQNPFVRYASALALLKEEEITDEGLESFLLDLELDLDEELPTVNVGTGNIDLTPTKGGPMHKRKKLKESIKYDLHSE